MRKSCEVQVELLQVTNEPEWACFLAAKQCYAKGYLNEKFYFNEDVERVLEKCRNNNHMSIFEHATFQFGIQGISRACSHQLVRHRIASYGHQSQRYVEAHKDFPVVIPRAIQENVNLASRFDDILTLIGHFYEAAIKEGVKPEDARYLLPNATETKIVVSMNARELLNFFSLRLCEHAQWEIREMAYLMLGEVKKVAPLIFKNAGPPCISAGRCDKVDGCGRFGNRVQEDLPDDTNTP